LEMTNKIKICVMNLTMFLIKSIARMDL